MMLSEEAAGAGMPLSNRRFRDEAMELHGRIYRVLITAYPLPPLDILEGNTHNYSPSSSSRISTASSSAIESISSYSSSIFTDSGTSITPFA